jgi:hypothetical protein
VHFCLHHYYLIYLVIILYISFYSCTYWVPTISVLNLAISLCYTNLLLRRWRWTGIHRRGILDYALPRLLFMWCYGVFRYSISLESRLVFKDIICVINIFYLWHLVICEHFGPYVWNNWSWAYIQWVLGFACKIGYDRSGTRALSTIGMLA